MVEPRMEWDDRIPYEPDCPACHHDLAGLDAHMALLLPLEDVAVALDAYRQAYGSQLTTNELTGLNQALRSLCLVLESLHHRPS